MYSPSRPSSAASSRTAVSEAPYDSRLAEAEAAHGEYPKDGEKAAKPPLADPFQVGWDGPDDPRNPKNWSKGSRWALTAFGGLLVLNATLASSAPAGQYVQIERQLSLSPELFTLTISLFVAGYCIGPLFWGPLSEQLGRRPIALASFVCHTAFSAGCALSPSGAALLVFRFLAGAVASAPLTNTGAMLGDIWDPTTRGIAMSAFCVAPFAGPIVGPIVSGFMADAGVDWRWTFWVLTIFSAVLLVSIALLMPETYTPILLSHKARAIRLHTGDQRYYAPLDREETTFTSRVEATLCRPFQILFSEPMHFSITLYMSFVYGCIYLLFEAYPLVFTQSHHLSAGLSGLCYLPVFAGAVAAVAVYLAFFHPRYKRRVIECAPRAVPPEIRLEMACVGGVVFAIGFFWFGWTSFAEVSLWAPMMAGTFLGAGVVMIYLPLLNYILDAYLPFSASALASNTVCRSAFGAGFPLFATQMFVRLGTPWAATLLGAVALVMVPIPFLLIRWGKGLRSRSRYGVADEE